MSDAELPGLEHYALKSNDYGQLTGLSIACHAVPDCFLLMHVGVGCKNKATAHLLVHDWKEHANLREGWTEVGDRDLILGASERAGPYLRSWYKRMEPNLIVTTSVTFLELAGEDLPDRVASAAKDVPCDVLHVKAPGYTPDLYRGYANLVLAIAQQVDWKQAPDRRGEVAVLGYLWDRYEGDHEGNLAQVRGLLRMLGLTLGPVLLSGRPYAELLEAHRSEHVLQLPWARPVARKLRRTVKGRDPIVTDLPMGLRGTSRWLRTMAAAVGVDPTPLERRIQQRERYVLDQLETMLDRWRSQRVAVFAETPVAAGLCSTLVELGMQPVLVGLRDRTLGGAASFREVLDADGVTLPDDCELVEDPSLALVRERLATLLDEGRLDGVIGASTDLNMLSTLAPRKHVGEHVSGRLEPQGPWMLELGFPCRDYHAMMPMPFLGYGGVVILAQRIVDAKRLWDAGRGLTFQL